MPLTVRGLTEIPNLETRLHAGAAGAERAITWAHAIELPKPWEWLEAGDLLMTIGLGLPTARQEQVTYVERCSQVGVSGIAFGEGFPLPPLSGSMIEAAEELEMPILFIGWNVPFAQVSRIVAAANYGPQLGRLVRSVRIYDLARQAVAAHSCTADLLVQLETEVGCRLYVCTNATGAPAFTTTAPPPEHVQQAFIEALGEHDGRLPGFLRLATPDGETLLVVPIPSQRPASLLAVPRAEIPPFAILQHVATVAALELERMWSHREELRRLGSETLSQLLEGHMIQGTAAALERLAMDRPPFVLVALAHDDGPQPLADLHHTLADNGVASLLLQRDNVLYTLVQGDTEAVANLAALLPAGTRVGSSHLFDDPTEARVAAQQARWALSTATTKHPLAYHGTPAALFGPRSPAEAQVIVDQVLDPLVSYDAKHQTDLLRSLTVFLRCNRSWKAATAELFVHKQTLIYRMRRVEELTGRNLSETADVAELWLALRAYEMLA